MCIPSKKKKKSTLVSQLMLQTAASTRTMLKQVCSAFQQLLKEHRLPIQDGVESQAQCARVTTRARETPVFQ